MQKCTIQAVLGRSIYEFLLSHDRTVRTCFRTGPDIPDMIPDTIPDTIGHSYRTQSDTLPDTIGHYRT